MCHARCWQHEYQETYWAVYEHCFHHLTPALQGAGSKSTMKPNKRTVPSSFVEVVDCLCDTILSYQGSQAAEDLADLVDTPAGGS